VKQIISTPVVGDHRFKQWTKTVTKVDTSKTNGFAFEGRFLRGKEELEIGTFILAWGCEGSRAHNSPLVNLFQVTVDGIKKIYEQEDLAIHWTLDVRDDIAKLVNVPAIPAPGEVNRKVIIDREGA